MTHNLRDQLLGLGFKPAPKPERPPERKADGAAGKPRRSEQGRPGAPATGSKPGAKAPPGARTHQAPRPSTPRGNHAGPSQRTGPSQRNNSGSGKPRTQDDIDLAKAYAIRAQREKDERIAAEQAKQEEARLRREARLALTELVKGHGLNAADAEIARHFPYGGKIKRVYVTPAQLKQLNAGELGVLQMDGRYMLVTAQLLAQAETIFPPAVALKVDPNAPSEDDPYADPLYQVPDDLVW